VAYSISGIKPNIGQLKLYSKPIVPTWKSHTFDLFPITSITYNNGLFVAAGDGLATSTDGMVWTVRTASGVFTNPITHVLYTSTNGYGYTSGNEILVQDSSIPTKWTSTTSGTLISNMLDVSFNTSNNTFINVGDGGYYVATNGTWFTQNSTFSNQEFTSVSNLGNVSIISGEIGKIRTATNITALSNLASRSLGASDKKILSLSSNGTSIVIGATNDTDKKYAKSSSGYTWEWIDGPIISKKMIYANNTFFMANDSSQLYASNDGITWEEHKINTPTIVNSICYGNGMYLACGIGENKFYTLTPVST